MSTAPHSVLFPLAAFTAAQSRDWLARHNLVPVKMARRTANFRRYRIEDPANFRRFFTKRLAGGVEIVFGVR